MCPFVCISWSCLILYSIKLWQVRLRQINRYRILARKTLMNMQYIKHLKISFFDASGNLAG